MRLLSKKTFKYGTWAYTQVIDLEYDSKYEDLHSIISNVIKTKWFIWQGDEHPDGMLWHMQNDNGESEESKNIKTHGYYDVELMNVDDFQNITVAKLLLNFTSFVKSNLDDSEKSKEYLVKVNRFILERTCLNVDCYQLKNIDISKKSIFSVYSFFISFLIINQENNIITLIEFGQD